MNALAISLLNCLPLIHSEEVAPSPKELCSLHRITSHRTRKLFKFRKTSKHRIEDQRGRGINGAKGLQAPLKLGPVAAIDDDVHVLRSGQDKLSFKAPTPACLGPRQDILLTHGTFTQRSEL